ncbi:M23 family metallopeptidase [Thermoproteota archaeon]
MDNDTEITTATHKLLAASSLINVTTSQSIAEQGDTLIIKIKTPKPIAWGTIWFNQKAHHVFNDPFVKALPGYHYISYLGVHASQKPGRYHLKTVVKFKNGQIAKNWNKIKINKANFRTSSITITGKKTALVNNRQQISNEAFELSKGFKTVTRVPNFRKSFISPSKGRRTTPFGAYRIYNGRHSSRHTGIDIANTTGTKIHASNDGYVIFSKRLNAHGTTIMIDHGYGIITVYCHLSQAYVKKGDHVCQGQEIGLMGATGIATGSHLHFGMSIQNVRVNPENWLKH